MLDLLSNFLYLSPSTAADAFPSSGDHESCPADSPLSCSSSSTPDSCCYEGSNGLFLQTQFWDYSPATGPDDVWTIHGLWSDRCGGGYRQFCNPSWEIDSAEQTLNDLGLTDLVASMSKNWKNQGKSDDDLWTHEFNKHGTCMSTVSPSCYSGGAANENVGDFFKRVVSLWETLPSYEWLSDAGITPSEDKTWTVAEFANALESHTDNKKVYLGCDHNNAINQIWYFFNLRGSVADGEFNHIDTISTSSCTNGFKYLPKGSSGGGGGGGGGDTPPETGRGYLEVIPSGSSSSDGCLISDGSWFKSGTCATFHVSESTGGVSIRSSKGKCGVRDNKFHCGGSVSGDFEMQGNKLSFGGSTIFSAEEEPSGNRRVPVYPDDESSVQFELELSS